MQNKIVLIRITSTGDIALYVNGQQVIAANPLSEPADLVEEAAKSLGSILGAPVIVIEDNESAGVWDWSEVHGRVAQHVYTDSTGRVLQGVDGSFYQWLEPILTDDGMRFLQISDGENNLSELLFASEADAIDAIERGLWGWGPVDAENYVLVHVNKTVCENPFRTNFNKPPDVATRTRLTFDTGIHPDEQRHNSAMSCLRNGLSVSIAVVLDAPYFNGKTPAQAEAILRANLAVSINGVSAIQVETGMET